MAGPQAALQGQMLAQAVAAHELQKIVPWHSNPSKDAYPAEHWWRKFRFAATAGAWNWIQVQSNFYNAMKDKALNWYESLPRHYVYHDIEELETIFLKAYGQTANSRTAITDIRVSQGSDSVINYWGDVNKIMDELELSVAPYVAPINKATALPVTNAVAGDLGAASVALLTAANVLTDHRNTELAGYNRLMIPITRAIFIAGLNPKIQDEVVRQNPGTAAEALDAAQKAEKEWLLKTANLVNELSLTPDQAQQVMDRMVDNSVSAIRGRPSFRGRGRGGRFTRGGPPRSGGPDKTASMCFYCNKKGHWQRECHKRQRENGALKAKSVHEQEVDEDFDYSKLFTMEPPQDPKNW